MLCLLESKPLDNHSEVLSSMFTTTVGECIAKCNEANNPCNSVYYVHNAMDERNVCYHLTYKIQAGSDLRKNNGKFLYYIQKCDLASNGIVSTNATSNSVNKVHLPLFKLNCYLEQQSLSLAMNSTFIGQEFSMNNDLCAYYCHVRNSCNAISFMAEENICILYHSEIDDRISVSTQEEYSEFYLMLGCIDDAVSVTTILLTDSYGNRHTLSFRAPDEVLSLNMCMHHCLSTGLNWVFRAVVYHKEKKICELYTKNANGSSILSDEEQKMIKLYNCFKDREYERINNPEPLNIFFEELGKTSEQTRFVTYFSEENLSCLLEHRHLKQNETSVLEKLPLSTLTDCIVACYLRNQSGFCNEIYFSKSKLICYFIEQQEGPFEDTDEEHRYLYYFIHKCAFGKKNLLNDEKIQRKSHNFDTLKSYVVLHDVSQICYLEQRSLKETKNAIAFRNITSSSLFSCIYFCQQWSSFAHCNAVSYSLKTGDCILYHDYVPGLQRSSVESSSTKFYSVFLCLDISIEVISIEIIKGTNFNFECSTEITPEQHGIVSEDFERQPFSSRGSEWMKYIASFGSRSVFLTANLYEFFEICKIKIVDPRSIKNLILHESHLRVNSLNTCLHKCRHAISEWPYRAVHYSSEKKYCHIYVKSNETSVNVTLEADEQFVELQTCFTDRRYDRANNPDALVFYIKSQREVCLVEFYRKIFLNHWKTINYIMNATNIIECLSWCRHYDNRDQCSAINFAVDGKCRLLKKFYRRASYRTLRKSVFDYVLFYHMVALSPQRSHSLNV
ncbi:hypothetical protein T01_11683 [Trichinella spiralis]|uniref:Apple domain-containing protein n=1 Tax=Trichinella spiralis TaxID=6334 RepID=A0A0V1BYZ5_TRISP|nr:hypothetical protein T01_11683 [Trichinella spiralis]